MLRILFALKIRVSVGINLCYHIFSKIISLNIVFDDYLLKKVVTLRMNTGAYPPPHSAPHTLYGANLVVPSGQRNQGCYEKVLL